MIEVDGTLSCTSLAWSMLTCNIFVLSCRTFKIDYKASTVALYWVSIVFQWSFDVEVIASTNFSSSSSVRVTSSSPLALEPFLFMHDPLDVFPPHLVAHRDSKPSPLSFSKPLRSTSSWSPPNSSCFYFSAFGSFSALALVSFITISVSGFVAYFGAVYLELCPFLMWTA